LPSEEAAGDDEEEEDAIRQNRPKLAPQVQNGLSTFATQPSERVVNLRRFLTWLIPTPQQPFRAGKRDTLVNLTTNSLTAEGRISARRRVPSSGRELSSRVSLLQGRKTAEPPRTPTFVDP